MKSIMFYITNKQRSTITPSAKRYHINILKSCVLIYFNKNLIQMRPATKAMKIPKTNIPIFALINVIVESFKSVSSAAPATTGADK